MKSSLVKWLLSCVMVVLFVFGLGQISTFSTLQGAAVATAQISVLTSPFINGNVTVNGDKVQIQSHGPGLYFQESDQGKYRLDYGQWRIVADHNALYFENWELGTSTIGVPFEQQDEFLSFHRYPTTLADVGNHLIQWQYDFLGSGVRNLNIGANWANETNPQTARTLSLVSLNAQTNELVPALQVVPANDRPGVSIPNGDLTVAGALTTTGTGAGLHLFNRTNNTPAAWIYSPAPGIVSFYSDVTRKDTIVIRGDGADSRLCIQNTCINETQLKALLKLIGN